MVSEVQWSLKSVTVHVGERNTREEVKRVSFTHPTLAAVLLK